MNQPDRLSSIQIITLDIDGTLTDGTTTWAGSDIGWVQTYSVRDGQAILAVVGSGMTVVPLSANRTRCARERMTSLGLLTTWVGVSDKIAALQDIAHTFQCPTNAIMHVGDGPDDAEVFRKVALGVCPNDAHPTALEHAAWHLERKGGERAFEELALTLLGARNHAL